MKQTFNIGGFPKTSPEQGESPDILIPKRIVFGTLAGLLLLWLCYTGVANRGYESKTINFSGFSKRSHGSGFGLKQLFLRKGQTFVADYETQVERGGLAIRLTKYPTVPGTPAVGQVRLDQSQTGQLRIPVDETGIYQILIYGSPGGDGYRVSYKVSWKVE